MTTNIERAIDAMSDANDGFTEGDVHRMAQALADAGLLMEDRQTPDTGETSGIADWRVNSWDISVYPDSNGHPAMIHIENRTRMTKPYVFNSQKAREFGEVMIAAANHAEQEQSNE